MDIPSRDVPQFQRSGVNGNLTVNDKDVKCKIQLGFLLSLFENKIRQKIQQFCEKSLT